VGQLPPTRPSGSTCRQGPGKHRARSGRPTTCRRHSGTLRSIGRTPTVPHGAAGAMMSG